MFPRFQNEVLVRVWDFNLELGKNHKAACAVRGALSFGPFLSMSSRYNQRGGKMKLLIILTGLLLTQFASADSFTVIRDGKEYLCEQRGPLDPIGSVECANKAYAGPFSREESQELCMGARSVAPADCALKAYSGPFNRAESIQLCKRARTTGPVECANKAYSGPFNRDESIQLCSGNGSLANAECALKAYAGPYNREEAIRMCKEQPHLVLRSLELLAQSQELKPKIESIRSKLKTSPAVK